MKPFALVLALLGVSLTGFSPNSQGQTATPPEELGTPGPARRSTDVTNSGRFGAGIKVSSLGLGAEAAVLLSHRSNLRAGFNVLGWSHTFTKDGIPYNGHLNFKTFEAHYDFFPLAGNFHVSPGILIYVADPIKASAFVEGDRSFTLGGVRFYSDPSSPATASGKIRFNRAAPTITVGWGNLISRKEGSRFSFPFEIGIAIQGSPKTSLAFGGNVCTSPGMNCASAATNPELQRNLASEENKINGNVSFLKVYPIISSGFAVRF
jgi:hypothetical protein